MSQSRRGRRSRVVQPRRAWLPGLLVAAGALLLAGALYALFRGPGAQGVPAEATGVPRLKVDRQKVDLGDVPLGQTVEVSFQLANTGDQPLRILQAPFVEVVDGC